MIVLVRVDHRLLHGQVVFTWTKSISTDCILIASDAVVKDELRMTALRLSKPNGVKLVMKSIDAVSYTHLDVYKRQSLLSPCAVAVHSRLRMG